MKALEDPELNFTKIEFLTYELEDADRRRLTARKNVEREHAVVGVGVGRAMALVENDDCRETRRGVVTELIPYLRNHGGSRFLTGRSHGVEHTTVVEAHFPGDVTTIGDQMRSSIQLINPPAMESPHTDSELLNADVERRFARI